MPVAADRAQPSSRPSAVSIFFIASPGRMSTPICPHRLAVRSFVLAAERQVSIRTVELGDKTALLSVDGANMTEIHDGDELRARASRHVLYMAHLSGRSFYDVAYEKLSDRRY